MFPSIVSLDTLKKCKLEFSVFSDSHDFSPLDQQQDGEPIFLRPRRSSAFRGWVLWLIWISSISMVGFGAYWLGQNNGGIIDDALAPSSVFDALGRVPFDPQEYNLSAVNRQFPEPLGKKILILDVDSRPWDPSVALKEQEPLGYGRLNHYLYAKMHGYDYKFVKPITFHDRHNTWVKVDEIYRQLQTKQYKFVVFADADVLFFHLKLPLEALFDRWNLTSDIAIAAALDPATEDLDFINKDRFRKANLNTGLVVAQNTPTTDAIFRDWIDCPTEVKFGNCSKWKNDRFHEQSALSEFIRYEWPDNIRQIRCSDANSAPEQGRPGKCVGTYIRHYWTLKSQLKMFVEQSVHKMVMEEVQKSMTNEWEEKIFFNFSKPMALPANNSKY